MNTIKYAGLAQLAARQSHNLKVVSSILTPATKGMPIQKNKKRYFFGHRFVMFLHAHHRSAVGKLSDRGTGFTLIAIPQCECCVIDSFKATAKKPHGHVRRRAHPE